MILTILMMTLTILMILKDSSGVHDADDYGVCFDYCDEYLEYDHYDFAYECNSYDQYDKYDLMIVIIDILGRRQTATTKMKTMMKTM